MPEQEIDLFEYVNVLMKYKILIFVVIVVSGTVAAITAPPLKKSYEVSMIIDIYKTDVPLADLLSKINEGTFDEKILNNSNLDLKKSGINLSASLVGSSMVKVKTLSSEKNVDNAVKAVNVLYEVIRKEQEENLNSSEQSVYQQSLLLSTISENKNEIAYLEQKIKLLEDNKIKLSEELTDVKKKYKELNDSNESFILNKNPLEKDQSIINNSYVLQQKLNLINSISSQIESIKSEKESLRSNIRKFKLENEKLKIEIDKLEKGYGSIKNVKLLKSPAASLIISGGKKSAKVSIAGFIGLMVGCFIAFFLEFIKTQKAK